MSSPTLVLKVSLAQHRRVVVICVKVFEVVPVACCAIKTLLATFRGTFQSEAFVCLFRCFLLR